MVQKNEKKENPIVEITAITGAFTVAITAIVLVFANNYAWILIFIIAAMCLFGIFQAKEAKNYEFKKTKK